MKAYSVTVLTLAAALVVLAAGVGTATGGWLGLSDLHFNDDGRVCTNGADFALADLSKGHELEVTDAVTGQVVFARTLLAPLDDVPVMLPSGELPFSKSYRVFWNTSVAPGTVLSFMFFRVGAGQAGINQTVEDCVLYTFGGFDSPVDGVPMNNTVKAGRAVPVKFSLGGDQGLDIFAEDYPKSQTITCNSTAEVDGIEETLTAGDSSLHYDAATGEYTYVWKTDRNWTGCRQLVLKLADGTFHRANFQFLR
jgi:hypothetical protein